ncbi:bifunctional nuclease domain-containing protein [Emticicia sp. W12TSBA100-4]|uniref:bifunctional nuclease domain-containing protein n=1 Tax=Emticicia sp. W12TSBA100-4 TaxID=3160965 RepID=UPI003305C3EF
MNKIKVHISTITESIEDEKDFTVVLQNTEYVIGIRVRKQQAVLLYGAISKRADLMLPHTLINKILEPLNYRVTEIVIDNLFEGTYNSLVYYSNGKNIYSVDSAVNDALIISAINSAPIYIVDTLLHQYGTKIKN